MNNQIHEKEHTRAHQADHSVMEMAVQLLCENGLSPVGDAMRLLLNEAMRIERSQDGQLVAKAEAHAVSE